MHESPANWNSNCTSKHFAAMVGPSMDQLLLSSRCRVACSVWVLIGEGTLHMAFKMERNAVL